MKEALLQSDSMKEVNYTYLLPNYIVDLMFILKFGNCLAIIFVCVFNVHNWLLYRTVVYTTLRYVIPKVLA